MSTAVDERATCCSALFVTLETLRADTHKTLALCAQVTCVYCIVIGSQKLSICHTCLINHLPIGTVFYEPEICAGFRLNNVVQSDKN